MSIKYLQDQQLNQVQQSPNNSPWAKLIAQSEMLERNKMRQPQGQAPQGTVAGNIQQQLMAAQQQEGERQNADLYKSQMLAQLIGSGQIPANFSAQGYADGGLTQPQAGTGAYRGIVLPGQTPQLQGMAQPQAGPISFRSALQPDSQDPNAQEKKHGMLQSLLDNSIVGMAQGKANIGNAMQDYADLFSGKIFSRGFAEGGDIRGFAGGGGLEKFLNRYPSHPSTTGIKPYLEPATGTRFQDVPELQKVLSEAKTKNELAELLRQDPSALDKVNAFFKNQPKGLPYIPQISESPELQEYYKSLYEPKTRGDVYNSLAQRANAPTPTDSGVEQMKIPPRGSVLPQEQPNVGPRVDPTAEFKSRMYGENSGINPARSNLMGTLFNVAEQKEAVNPARSNLMGTLLNVAEQKEAQVNPARSNLMGTLLNVAEQKEALANQPQDTTTQQRGGDFEPRSSEAKAWMASQQPQTKAPPQEPASKYASGYFGGDSAAPTTTKGIGSLLKGTAGLALTGLNPSSIDAVTDLPKEELDRLAKAQAEGGMKGELSYIADTMKKDIAKGNAQIGDFVTSNIAKPWDKFWNGPNAGAQTNAQPDAWTGGATTPQTPPTTLPQTPQAQTPQAQTPQAQTPQAQTPQQGVRKREDGVTINSKSAGKAPDAKENPQVRDKIFNQGSDTNTTEGHPVGDAVAKTAALTQTIQAADKTSDTGMGQGSILDSLYSKLKDTDVDYSDLAKRISENEYDLARERKDGTFNAILGGVGAALSKAGSYEGVGDRVFRPGLGAIAGAGIMGGLKMANESDAAIAKKSQDNTMSMLALKKLKGDSLNNVLDAISAQKQNEVYAQSVANNAVAHKDTAANNAMKNAIDYQQLGINRQMAFKNMEHLDAQIADLYNKASSDPNLQGKVNLAADKAKTAKDVLTSLTNGMVQPSDPRYIKATSDFNAAFADLNSLGIALKIPTTVVPNAGSQTPQTTEEWAQQGYIKR